MAQVVECLPSKHEALKYCVQTPVLPTHRERERERATTSIT
jgi:hypothetical protein